MTVAADDIPREIVGVVATVRQLNLQDAAGYQIYEPHLQSFALLRNVIVRRQQNPLGIVDGIRGIVKALDPDLAVNGIKTVDEVVWAATERERFLRAASCL